MMNVLLDLGGEYFGGTPLPIFSNGLDANTYLLALQNRFKLFIENRLLMTNLISRLGSDVATVDWYKKIDYILYLGDLEHQNFVGTVKERYEQAKSLEVDKSIRISILGGLTDGIFIGTRESNVGIAKRIANYLSVFEDVDIVVPKVKVVIPFEGASDSIERLLNREMKDSYTGKNTVIDVIFVVKDNGDFVDALNSDTGLGCLVHWLSDSIDVVIERENERAGDA